MAANNQSIPPELQELFDLGKAGKLWTIEVVYSLEGVTKVVRKRNMTDDELLKWRESMCRYGLTHWLEPGHWKLVLQVDIFSTDIYKQSSYFPE